jgi:N-acetylneuraminate synthase
LLKTIANMQHVRIIAEAGVNHNGNMDLAMELIEVAAAAGADIVKFQSFKAASLVTAQTKLAAYQAKNLGENPESAGQHDMLTKLELSQADHVLLAEHCQKVGIQFLSTPFDGESLDMLVDDFGIPLVKIPSGEVTNAPFILRVARKGLPIVLSTGMCTLADIEQALGVIAFGMLEPNQRPTPDSLLEAYLSAEGAAVLRKQVSLLHCTTEYPTLPAQVNLRAMVTLREAFGLTVGYSDHTLGTAIPVASVALGAAIIEKHYTISRGLPGPDHLASLEPKELAEMVSQIRIVSEAMGSGRKVPEKVELQNRTIARKSLVAATDIKAGELFTEYNLTAKRPGTGISPIELWSILGQPALRDFAADELIS